MRKKRLRLSTLFLVALAVMAGIMLFRISERVQTAEDNLLRMEEAAAKEAETIRVLRAEWDYLNRPDRLETLARRHLGMEGPDVTRVMHDGGDLPPQPAAAVVAVPVSIAPGTGAPEDVPPLPRLKPRRDTQDFRSMLDSLKPAAGGSE